MRFIANKKKKDRPRALKRNSEEVEEQIPDENIGLGCQEEEPATGGCAGTAPDSNRADPGGMDDQELPRISGGTDPWARRVNPIAVRRMVSSNVRLGDLYWKQGTGAGRVEELTGRAKLRDTFDPLEEGPQRRELACSVR